MGYPYYGQPYGPAPGYPGGPYGPYGPNQGSNFTAIMACEQSTGLGGKQQIIPTQYPINLQYVVQEVVMFLMGQGFQTFPMIGYNLAIIQAQHKSLLGYLTDSNKAYTIRLCQGQGMVIVETGMANLMQDLITAGATAFIADDVLHSGLLTVAGGGLDAYEMYKQYSQEEQLFNMITMLVMQAPPAYQGQPGSPYSPQGQPPMSRPPQPPTQPTSSAGQIAQPPSSINQTPQPQTSQKCWSCGEPVPSSAKYCPNCGASLQQVKCPQCGSPNPPSAKFCSSCGTKLK
ncbi:zinc ribbon domain-containing protein [Metallosphaera sedula]|uniref:zinc ribbon domain-containing protein n=1 Tax=Metallosphaera sedula TaxID=43687 RepID=UPI0020BDA804|nr:zinc ribbon domain-containing protein [Metallosphaera sedula]BBL46430.1 zinc ribbon domain-containing protein [Metallosphaera sedula]